MPLLESDLPVASRSLAGCQLTRPLAAAYVSGATDIIVKLWLSAFDLLFRREERVTFFESLYGLLGLQALLKMLVSIIVGEKN